MRRRLESYHADPDVQSGCLIQIPLGSYSPVFPLRRAIPPQETWSGTIDSPTFPLFVKNEPAGAIYTPAKEVTEPNASSSTIPDQHALPADVGRPRKPPSATRARGSPASSDSTRSPALHLWFTSLRRTSTNRLSDPKSFLAACVRIDETSIDLLAPADRLQALWRSFMTTTKKHTLTPSLPAKHAAIRFFRYTHRHHSVGGHDARSQPATQALSSRSRCKHRQAARRAGHPVRITIWRRGHLR